MIKKDDVMQLHDTIAILKGRQNKAKLLAKMLLDEIDGIDGMLEVLTKEYEGLKRKAEK